MARTEKSFTHLMDDAHSLSRRSALSGSHYARKRRKAVHGRIVRNAAIALAVLVVVIAAGAFAWLHAINSNLNEGIDDNLKSTLTPTESGQPFYMLLLGVDKDEERADSADYGADDGAYRSDSIMLVRIDPQNKKVTLVSIHRDTAVTMDSYGTQKINAAYSFGGPSYATKVISNFAGVNISHYAEVDMDGMAKVVDAVGGVTVDLGVPVKDPNYTGLDLPAGEQTLDGATATLLCRARHAYDNYGDGDAYRAKNQRAVITAVAQKVLASDPATMANTVSAMAEMVHTDMDVSSIVSLAAQFKGMDTDKDIMSGMEPTTSHYTNNTWYEICDTTAWKTMMQRVDQGLPPYENGSEDPTAGVAASSSDEAAQYENTESTSSGSETTATYTGTVQVLNATTTNGAAATVAGRLTQRGFTATPGSLGRTSTTTKIIYNGQKGHAAALGVAETLGGTITPEENDSTYNTSSDVIVILGTDTY